MTLNDIVARHGAFINQAELAHATEIFPTCTVGDHCETKTLKFAGLLMAIG